MCQADAQADRRRQKQSAEIKRGDRGIAHALIAKGACTDEHSLSEKTAKSLGVLPAGLPRPPVRHISAAAVSQQPARASSCHSLTPAERPKTTRTRGTTDQPGKAHAHAATVCWPAGGIGTLRISRQCVRHPAPLSTRWAPRSRHDATSAHAALHAVLRSSRTGESLTR